MYEFTERPLKCRPTNNVCNESTDTTILADGGTASDLTAFQKACLAIASGIERRGDRSDIPYGLEIKRELEAYYGTDVNHGRLYPNLDELVEDGLLRKSEVDKRTNRYDLTDEGREILRADLEWHARRLGLTLVDENEEQSLPEIRADGEGGD